MKLDADDVTRICNPAGDQELNTQYVADRYDISRRRIQQLAKENRDTGEIATIETPGRKPYAEYPPDLIERILELYELHEQGAEAIAHILRTRDGITIDNNRVLAILQECDNVTKNPNKQGRKRPWVRWERDHSLITVHLDWYQNRHQDWVITVEDDASGKILGMSETNRRSSEATIDILDEVREEYAATGEILEVITDHGTELYANKRDKDGEADHSFETYLAENRIKHTLCAVGRPQSNGNIEGLFQTYDKQRWRFNSLDAFVDYYNIQRPHQNLRYDELETPAEAFERLLPTVEDATQLAVADGGEHGTK